MYAQVLITVGENGCPLDHIIETSTMISQNVQDIVTMVEPGGMHEELIMKFATGNGGSGKDYDGIVEFLSRAFQGS